MKEKKSSSFSFGCSLISVVRFSLLIGGRSFVYLASSIIFRSAIIFLASSFAVNGSLIIYF